MMLERYSLKLCVAYLTVDDRVDDLAAAVAVLRLLIRYRKQIVNVLFGGRGGFKHSAYRPEMVFKIVYLLTDGGLGGLCLLEVFLHHGVCHRHHFAFSFLRLVFRAYGDCKKGQDKGQDNEYKSKDDG